MKPETKPPQKKEEWRRAWSRESHTNDPCNPPFCSSSRDQAARPYSVVAVFGSLELAGGDVGVAQVVQGLLAVHRRPRVVTESVSQWADWTGGRNLTG